MSTRNPVPGPQKAVTSDCHYFYLCLHTSQSDIQGLPEQSSMSIISHTACSSFVSVIWSLLGRFSSQPSLLLSNFAVLFTIRNSTHLLLCTHCKQMVNCGCLNRFSCNYGGKYLFQVGIGSSFCISSGRIHLIISHLKKKTVVNIHNIKFTSITIFKCTVQQQYIHSYCYATITTIHPHNSLHLIKLKL